MSRFTVEDIPLGYAPVPPEMLLYRPKLKDADVRVWCAFAMHRNLKTGRTSAGVVRIAEILDVDRSTVTRAIARLIETGFLLRRRQNGRKNRASSQTPSTPLLSAVNPCNSPSCAGARVPKTKSGTVMRLCATVAIAVMQTVAHPRTVKEERKKMKTLLS